MLHRHISIKIASVGKSTYFIASLAMTIKTNNHYNYFYDTFWDDLPLNDQENLKYHIK